MTKNKDNCCLIQCCGVFIIYTPIALVRLVAYEPFHYGYLCIKGKSEKYKFFE